MAGILIVVMATNLCMILWTVGSSLVTLGKELWAYLSKKPAKVEIPEFEEDLPNSDDMRTTPHDPVVESKKGDIDQSELKSIGTTNIVEQEAHQISRTVNKRLKKVTLTSQNSNKATVLPVRSKKPTRTPKGPGIKPAEVTLNKIKNTVVPVVVQEKPKAPISPKVKFEELNYPNPRATSTSKLRVVTAQRAFQKGVRPQK